MEDEEIEEEEDEVEEWDAEYNIASADQVEYGDALEREAMSGEVQQVADTGLLKEGVIENQVEIETEEIEDMKRQVGEGVKQSLEDEEILYAEVNEEMKYEANSDSQKCKETAEREFEKTDYRSRRYKEEKNICSYKRKSKLDNHAYQEKVYNGKLNVFDDKYKTNYTRSTIGKVRDNL